MQLVHSAVCLLQQTSSQLLGPSAAAYAILSFATLVYVRSSHPLAIKGISGFTVIALTPSDAIAQQVVLFRYVFSFLLGFRFIGCNDAKVTSLCLVQLLLLFAIFLGLFGSGLCNG